MPSDYCVPNALLVCFLQHVIGYPSYCSTIPPCGDMSSDYTPTPSSDGIAPHEPVLPILIVDDDPVVLGMLRDVLQEDGLPVVSANNGVAALIHLQRSSVALVLTDFMMPGLSGLELADQLRYKPETAAIPVILISAFPPPDVGSRVAAVISKPFDLDELLRVVRRFWSQ